MIRRPYLDPILDCRLSQKLLTSFGVEPRQYRLLLDLFDVLGERLEFMGGTVSLYKIAGFYAGFSFLLSLTALFRPALENYLLGMLGLSMFCFFWILLEDATNCLLNPDEAPALAHMPVGGATYVAAKLTHILYVLTLFVLALNGIPALAGLILKGAHWYYPLTHLLAAYMAGLFIAFLIFGAYGWLFRFVPLARLKNAALWLQVFALPSLMIIQNLLLFSERRLGSAAARTAAAPWMPLAWFAAIGLIGHSTVVGFSVWRGGVAVIVTCGLIAFGMRSFREDYLVKVSTLLQVNPARAVRRRQGLRWGAWVCWLTGAPSGCGAFAFTRIMLCRDWNMRRQALPMTSMYLLGLIGIIATGIRISPFSAGSIAARNFSPMHFFPHCLAAITLMPCALLSFTAEPRGSWIFVNLPLDQPRPFVRGMFLSLWIPFVAIPHFVLLGPCIWFWGAASALLFLTFSLVMASLYLALEFLTVQGLPFVDSFSPSRAEIIRFAPVLGLILALLLGGIQWLVFRSEWLVLWTTLALALLAAVLTHFSLGKLEKAVATSLELLRFGPQHLFREIGSSGM